MAAHVNSLPELDQRLVQERSAFVHTVDALRHRVREDIYELSPRQQLRHHSGATLTAVGIIGLIAGRIVGGVLGALL